MNNGTLAADGGGMLNILPVTLLDTLLVDIPVPRIVSAAGTDGAGGAEVPPLACWGCNGLKSFLDVVSNEL